MLSSFNFSYPWWALILPLPLIILYVIPAYGIQQKALKVPFFDYAIGALGDVDAKRSNQLKPQRWQQIALVIAWCLVVIALMKPTILGQPQVKQTYGRDIMVVVDLSGSMAEQDFMSSEGQKVSRLIAAKEVLAEFVESRGTDRLGLILFGDSAFVQAPFTADHNVWLALLNQAEVAMAGYSTHLGDAIGLAIKVFDDTDKQETEVFNEEKEKVVIILTDGNDTGSFVDPVVAAKVAAVKGVRIHTVAIGDPTTVGETAIDMEVIGRIAHDSGGQAFEALNREQLSKAYQEINNIEPRLYQSMTYYPTYSLHHYFIGVVVVFYCVVFIGLTVARRKSALRRVSDV